MTVTEEEFAKALAGLKGQDWLDALDELAEDLGYFQPIGARHSAAFIDQSPTLIVSFDSQQNICRRDADCAPAGWATAEANGWSHLALISDGDTWFRDPAVYGYFDRLVDDGFFEDFDRVVFYGAGMGGYAAAAYSVVSPGATVVALQPQATLATDKAGWDTRFPKMRRTDFTSRYGYAPDMTEGAGDVFIIHEAMEAFDAMHATLFDAPYVHHHRTRLMVRDLEAELRIMGCLEPILEHAALGQLTPTILSQILRKRREFARYMRRLMGHLQDEDRPFREALVCRNFVQRGAGARFRRRLQDLQAAGVTLPSLEPAE
ncbi:phosphoadenosine phosphosulfate reductase [Cognatishimia sp. MH4019]|uniref:phosphoadenosine phosphosulfate reductase n=1 Tax=Cognatishimia sp. MH4019 TaxID=2854030 RepID=UPI001CD7B6AC|nr:phosphoadenosine phosphosulfate reductase [Cognatishimia sp. MH4019]